MLIRAREILRQAEAQLRNLLADAVTAGDYDAVTALAQLARKVDELTEERKDGGACLYPCPSPPPANTGQSSEMSESSRAVLRRPATRRAKSKPRKRGQRSTGNKYPRFHRQREELVKTAWSKREKKEYQHRAPWSAIGLVATAIAESAKTRDLIRTEDFLPVSDGENKTEVPNYQVYVCLAWMKKEGLIQPKGRQGYHVPELAAFESAVQEHWEKLPRNG